MRFAPHTDDDVRSMLDAIGLDSLDALFDQIPADVRVDHALDIPDGVSEMEILADLRSLAARNRHADDLVCFAGAGAYDHYVPSVVWALAGPRSCTPPTRPTSRSSRRASSSCCSSTSR